MKNFMNKPITWGSYLKLCGVSLLFSMISYAVAFYKFFR